MSFLSSISSFFGGQSSASAGTRSTRSRTLTSTHDAFSLPTHSPSTSHRDRVDSPGPQFSYPPAAAYSSSPTGFDYMPQSTRDNFRRSTLSSPGITAQSPIANTWQRIRKFMAREYPELGDSLNFGLAPAIIDQVEAELGMTLPKAVRESYLLCDGQEAESGTACAEGLFFGLTLLPLEEVVDEWRFWREVDEDPATGANPQLLQVMASIPTGWIRKAYSCRGWLPLVTDRAGNYLGVDLAPAEQGTYGQVIVFGRDFDTKVVMFRGEGEDGWATWLQSFVEELETGDGIEAGASDSASEGSDDVGYESYFYDGSGRSKGVGGARDGAAGIKLAGEYKGWNILEAFADKSYRRWRERDMAPDLDVLQNPVIAPQNVQLVGPGIGTGSGVEVPIPIMGGASTPGTPSKSRLAPMPPIPPNPDPPSMGKLDQPIPPTIQVTRASAPQPLLLPTQTDIIPATSEHDDLEAGTSLREVVPLRAMTREDSLDSTTSDKTTVNGSSSQMVTPTSKDPAGGSFSAKPEPSANLMDAQPEIAPVPALVPVPPPSEDEVAELEEGYVPETTIRLNLYDPTPTQVRQTKSNGKGMALINQLPPEVLIGVFGRTINTAYDLWDARPAVSITLTLCAVCSHWSRIMIGQTTFWAYIPVGTKTNAGDLTGLFLERSQNSSLIDVVAFDQHATIEQTPWRATKSLKLNIHRIRSLSIGVASSSQLNRLLHIVLRDRVPPALIHLSLMVQPKDYQLPRLTLKPELCKQNFVQLCNQLQALEMKNLQVNFNSYTFTQLEKLSLNVGVDFFVTMSCVLSTAHKLRFLEIRDITRWTVSELLEPELARGLKVLRLRYPHPFCRWELEGRSESQNWDVIDFHLPRSLTAGPKSGRNLECLVPYMRTNSSKITSLTLRNDSPKVLEQISTMLQVLPNLHTLTFDNLHLTHTILLLFMPPPNSSQPFPRLHTLRLILSSVRHMEVFKKLVSSHPIRRLELWHSKLNWDNGVVVRESYRPKKITPFYEWLRERVPELYISNP
ncbi:unnamed protein product [Rhizoctonia solani]|nr:unnamed protein product [Rhizoctonia solani]